ncbi:exodeoxyribonuclease III [Acidipropionibacterium timonense]|uniref:exodeoxyribonuclease III n=1 Tax=Acidipropionibacterium timonense TaxID=2161818 RepID=UPI00102F7912|nr:exodeoxyribonuclease III [Acidipropionibacterium timonense]
MRIATFNVNGIRAAQRRGFEDWLHHRDCDVVALQEVRCRPDDLPEGVFGGYHVVWQPGTRAGRNGVALLTRHAPEAVRAWGVDLVTMTPSGARTITDGTIAGLARRLHPFAQEGRYVEVDLADAPLTVASLYLPKGATPDPADPATRTKQDRKESFMAGFARHLTTARRRAAALGRDFLVMGDFNIAHENVDLRNWRSNRGNEGFLPQERAWLGSILSPRTLVDVVRSLHPGEDGPYSWWSWRGQAFVNDAGWRIDYHLATPQLARAATTGGTDRDPSYEARISDHAPVVVDYDL